MNNDTPVYTQAFNFISAAQGRVDPRTGLFFYNFPVASFTGNNNRGPSLALALRYSPMMTADLYGLGTGMSFGLSSYDSSRRILSLSTGETYKMETNGEVRQQKLHSFKIEHKQDEYIVTHKSGEREFLKVTAPDSSLYLPVCIESSTGFRLNLNWDGYNHLKSITDDDKTRFCIFTYNSDADSVDVTLYPDANTEDNVLITLDITKNSDSNYLQTITNHGHKDKQYASADKPLKWTLGYSWDKPEVNIAKKSLLTSISFPTGLVESVIYNHQGHRVSDKLFMQYIPAVSKYTTSPGQGQKDEIITYIYTDTNYLGGKDSKLDNNNDDDAIYNMSTNYTYGTTVTYHALKTAENRTVTYTYNNYHLETLVVTACGDCTHTQKTEYFIKPDQYFSQQPAVFQMPLRKSEIWEKKGVSPRKIITTYDYQKDNQNKHLPSGNLIQQTADDGTVTTFEYYPLSGEGMACPADPNNFFIRFLKSKKVTPVALTGDELIQLTIYQYKALSPSKKYTREGASGIVKTEEKHYVAPLRDANKTTLLVGSSYDYEEKKDADYGRLVKQTSTIWGDSKSYSSFQTYSYRLAGDDFHQVIQTTTHDGLVLESGQVHSRLSGKLLGKMDAAGNEVTYEYDYLGRLRTTTLHPGKPGYQANETYTYTLPEKDTPAMMLHTDIRKNQTRISYDGLGRQTGMSLCDADSGIANDWQSVGTIEWDELGRKKTVTSHDQYSDSVNNALQKMSFTRTTEWDAWGQPFRITDSDGLVHHEETDPIALTRTRWVSDKTEQHTSPHIVTTLDPKTHRPVKKECKVLTDKILTTYSEVTQVWDGMGRLRQMTDEVGHTTHWDYDSFGRTTVTTYPDGSKITKTYEPFSRAALINGISVTPADKPTINLGSQLFDGLGRCKSTTSGGRTTIFTYEQPWQTTPSTQKGPDNITRTHILDPLLGGAIKSVSANEILQTFHYDAKTGMMEKAVEGTEKDTCTTFQPHPSGRLKIETAVLLQGPSVDTEWHYSLTGRPIRIDSNGVKETRAYETTGRLERITDDAVEVTLKYDALGRLYHWDATERLTKAVMSTELTFDDNGREWKRSMTHTNGMVRHIRQEWKKNNLLEERFHYGKDEKTAVLSETYDYDSRNRLKTYTCSGTELPSDPYGNHFTRQDFEFDVLNNIIRCRTTLADGSVNEARYFFENKDDPCQLSGMTNGIPDRAKEQALPSANTKKTTKGYPEVLVLKYDKAGRMTLDEEGRTLTYDALGRLSTLTGGRYGYDAQNRMVYQRVDKTQAAHRLYYRANRLIEEWVTNGDNKPDIAKDSRIRLVYAAGGCVAQAERKDSKTEIMLTGTDAKHSVVTMSEGKESRTRVYTPYGYDRNSKADS